MPSLFAALPLRLPRLLLRQLRGTDLADFQSYRSDPVLARFQGWSAMTDEQAAEFLRAESLHKALQPGQWHQLAIALPQEALRSDSSHLIGDIGLWLSEDGLQAEFGITLARPHHGRGYASEAMSGLIALLSETSRVTELLARSDSRNHACLALLGALGMQHQGSRQEVYKGEVCVDELFALPLHVGPRRGP